MAARFADYPEAVAETAEIASRLDFDLEKELGYRYPQADDPTADHALSELCLSRLDGRYEGTPQAPEAGRRLREELRIIRGLGLSGFFLLHHDLLELAREVAVEVRGPDSARSVLPPGRGRGSSVSSIVCYLTGLSHVDPVKAELFPGRFLNDEVTAVPDIDLDFPRDIRAELIPRIHRRYGAERSALVAAFPTYRTRGAIRDFGKALGIPQTEIERAARAIDFHGSDDLERDLAAAIGSERAASAGWQNLVWLCGEARGNPRNPSQHSGGMVISTGPLVEICPVVPAAMEGRQIVQWDKDSCQDAGFLKVDLLGLGMLLGGRALHRRNRPDTWRDDRPQPDRPPGRADIRGDPPGRDHRRIPDREPGPDADAAADATDEPRRHHDRGRADPPRSDPGRRGPSLHRTPAAAA